jgi:hypothetical protein
MRISYLFVALIFFIATPAFSDTLTEPSTGLTLNAPKGYKLTSTAPGMYKLSKGKLYVRFMLANSPLNLSDTIKSFVKISKIKNSVTTKVSSKKRRVSGQLKGKSVVVEFISKNGLLDIAMYGGSSSRRSPSVLEPSARAVTVADIARLQAFLRSRQGGIQVPLQVQIPMRRFVAPDGGSSALVPALPGWSYSGGGGIIQASNFTQGIASLGVPVVVSRPGFGGSPPISEPRFPDAAIAVVWPQYVNVVAGAQVQVVSVQQVPGTEGWLGPNFLSALYAVRFNFNGRVWQALMLSGCFDMGSSIGWGWYHSYIAVPVGGPGGIGAALMDTWRTWDNSVASQQRLNQALQTILTTRVNGYPIDPDVFEKAAHDWDDYIRQ